MLCIGEFGPECPPYGRRHDFDSSSYFKLFLRVSNGASNLVAWRRRASVSRAPHHAAGAHCGKTKSCKTNKKQKQKDHVQHRGMSTARVVAFGLWFQQSGLLARPGGTPPVLRVGSAS